jgi:hypothetical protein
MMLLLAFLTAQLRFHEMVFSFSQNSRINADSILSGMTTGTCRLPRSGFNKSVAQYTLLVIKG